MPGGNQKSKSVRNLENCFGLFKFLDEKKFFKYFESSPNLLTGEELTHLKWALLAGPGGFPFHE
jgi:hypothetical protein